MNTIKTKSIENIERKMQDMDSESMRYAVLQNAKSFKASWIGLGQTLYSVWKDKMYKEWGYMKFDAYTSKEIGIRKDTALKLLRSYFFLEKEEPGFLKSGSSDEKDASTMPTLESIDALRLASQKKALDKSDYISLRRKVLQEGRDVREVKKDLTLLMREREELSPEEARDKRRQALLKRYITTLKNLKEELKASKMVSAQIINDTEKLLSRLESEVGRTE